MNRSRKLANYSIINIEAMNRSRKLANYSIINIEINE